MTYVHFFLTLVVCHLSHLSGYTNAFISLLYHKGRNVSGLILILVIFTLVFILTCFPSLNYLNFRILILAFIFLSRILGIRVEMTFCWEPYQAPSHTYMLYPSPRPSTHTLVHRPVCRYGYFS